MAVYAPITGKTYTPTYENVDRQLLFRAHNWREEATVTQNAKERIAVSIRDNGLDIERFRVWARPIDVDGKRLFDVFSGNARTVYVQSLSEREYQRLFPDGVPVAVFDNITDADRTALGVIDYNPRASALPPDKVTIYNAVCDLLSTGATAPKIAAALNLYKPGNPPTLQLSTVDIYRQLAAVSRNVPELREAFIAKESTHSTDEQRDRARWFRWADIKPIYSPAHTRDLQRGDVNFSETRKAIADAKAKAEGNATTQPAPLKPKDALNRGMALGGLMRRILLAATNQPPAPDQPIESLDELAAVVNLADQALSRELLMDDVEREQYRDRMYRRAIAATAEPEPMETPKPTRRKAKA